MQTYTAIRCPCGHRGCKSWMVGPVADVQGVRFSEEQARAVATLLNKMDKRSGDETMAHHWTDDAAVPVFTTRIDATGSGGNIYQIVGTACQMLAKLDIPPDRIEALREDVKNAVSYDQAVAFVERWFPVDRSK